MLKSLHSLLALPLLLLPALPEVAPVIAAAWDLQIFAQELGTGFTHIFPEGLDHMAFLLGMFFLSRSLPSLLLQTTLFTFAHSLTLGAVVIMGIEAPERWVETAVGLSIAALAVEGFAAGRLERWRPIFILLFGGVHGLAFAHSLVQAENIRLSPLSALFGFNLGIELGQLAVIAVLVLAFSTWWERPWYRTRVCLPALTILAISGLHWAWERW